MEIDKEVLLKALTLWGTDAQLRQLDEELGELIVASCKVQRNKRFSENFHEEIADVLIMIEQIKMLKEVDIALIDKYIDEKVSRLRERVTEFSYIKMMENL